MLCCWRSACLHARKVALDARHDDSGASRGDLRVLLGMDALAHGLGPTTTLNYVYHRDDFGGPRLDTCCYVLTQGQDSFVL